MKKMCLILVFLLILALCGCGSRSDGNYSATAPETIPERQDSFDAAEWDEFSDYELLEKAIKSDTMAFYQLCAVKMTEEEWKDYVLENCKPIRALMLRETAAASVGEFAANLAGEYHTEPYFLAAENFAVFVITLYPELEQQFADFDFTWFVSIEIE